MRLKNMKVGTRLGAGFGFILLLTAILAFSGLHSLGTVTNGFKVVTDDIWPKTNIANQNIQGAYDYARAFSFIITSEGKQGTDPTALKAAYDELTGTVKLVNDNVADLEKRLSSDEEKAMLVKIKESRAVYGKSRNHVLELKKEGRNDEATELWFTETNALQTTYIQTWKIFIKHEEALLNGSVDAASAAYQSAKVGLTGVLVAALVCGTLIALAITRGLLSSLGGEPNDVARIAERIAAGDLAVEVDVQPKDESSLLYSMRNMRDNLEQIVGQVRGGTEAIAAASSQLASGNMDLSARTEAQAGALEETASSMEELTSTVRQNADNAKQANQLANSASDVAVKGGAVVAQVVETMGQINESSRKIVDIISVIDGIAFQTNILALNAAVEAARAGEQGRGFAVVASEVRNLAQRSAAAAREIKTLISDSVTKVELGSGLVDQAGETMHEVVASIKRVNDIVAEISSASSEQSSGIDQINIAVADMDNTTQQNAALVEQAAATASAMTAQAATLERIVSIFTLRGERRSGMPVSPAARPTVAGSHHAANQPAPKMVANVAKPKLAQMAGDDDWEQF